MINVMGDLSLLLVPHVILTMTTGGTVRECVISSCMKGIYTSGIILPAYPILHHISDSGRQVLSAQRRNEWTRAWNVDRPTRFLFFFNRPKGLRPVWSCHANLHVE